MASSIQFHEAGASYLIRKKKYLRQVIHEIINKSKRGIKSIDIIICGDSQIKSINKQHLQHNYATDVITFDYNPEQEIVSDIFIGIDVVRKNAQYYQCSTAQEVYRVILHGILHLVGYDDGTTAEQIAMRQAENQWLTRLNALINSTK